VAGTTVLDSDNAVARSVCDALGAAGVDVGIELVDPVMGMPKPLAIRTLLSEARGDTPSKEEVDAIHEDFRRRMIEHYRTAPGIAPMPGAEQVFAALRERGVKIALDTGFDRPILDTILARLGWDDGRLDATVTSDEVENGRPAPDLIFAAMAQTGVTDASHVAKIGDSESDLGEGIAAGCGLVCAIKNGRTEAVLGEYPSVRAIGELPELLMMFEEAAAVQ